MSQGANRECVNMHGQSAFDVAGDYEVKRVLLGFEKRLCVIVCDEVGRRFSTNVFSELRIDKYL